MRTRLVFWGKNPEEEKVLLGIKLNEKENDVDVYIFPESIATEDFVNQMHQKWRVGEDLAFPEGHTTEKRPLGISSSLLPDGYTVERDDILKRAQTEWHFVVLSSKLFDSYDDELQALKERVAQLTKFDSGLWEELKGFWSKVQEQVRERNLFHDHATKIKQHTNDLFGELKQLRKALDKEFQIISDEHFQTFKEKLQTVEKKIEDGLSLQPIFQELKDLQRSFRDTKFTGDHRGQIWKKLDGLFKTVKEKKYGAEAANSWSNPLERVQRRYKGLMDAIGKMERSIERDRKDQSFEQKRIETAEGSLESQIRAAKSKMIEERIGSKAAKLDEMLKTKKDLERRIKSLEQKEEARKEREKVKEAKAEIKAKIAEEIKAAEKDREDNEQVQKAAQSIAEARDAVVETVEDGIEDVVDTIKAVASVIESTVQKLFTSEPLVTNDDESE